MPLQKRQTISLNLNECLEGLRFKRSQCLRSIFPSQHYSINCVYYGWDGTPRGSLALLQQCPPDYLCIDAVRPMSEAKPIRRVRTTYLVHTENFYT